MTVFKSESGRLRESGGDLFIVAYRKDFEREPVRGDFVQLKKDRFVVLGPTGRSIRPNTIELHVRERI